MIRRLIPLCLPAIILNCTTPPALQHPDPPAGLPEMWTALATTDGLPASLATDAQWWTSMGDERLAALVEEGLAHNHDLAAAVARVDRAVAAARIAGATTLPQIQAGGDASRNKRNFIGFPIPGGGGSTATTTYKATLSASWELDLWGRLRSGAAKAIADAQAAAADLAGARLSLQAKIVRAFYNAIDSRLQVELLEATTNNLEVSTLQIRARYERGLRPSFDVRLAESNLAGTRAALALRRRAHDTAVRQLELLLGRYPAAEIEISEQLPPMPQAIPSGLPAQLVSRRPDLAAAERRLVAADLLLGEARRALLPRISLTGSAGRSSEDLGDLLDGDFAVWNLIGNITMPLFQGGRLRRQVDAAVAGKEQEIASYAQRVLTAFAEVEQALVAEQLLTEQEAALRIASRQAAAAERLSQHRYRHGLSDLIAYLDAQRRTFEARSQLLTVQRQRLEARVSLHVALGGGFRFDNPPDNS